MTAKGIRCERADGFERWSLDNPERRNAVTPSALRFITERSAKLEGEVVVLDGADAGPFCSGFDLTALARALESEALPDQVLADAAAAMQSADATFVASVRGYVIGAGVELLAACDLRIVDDAAFVLVPAGKLGVVYHADGLMRMRAAFGPVAVRTLLLSGRKVLVQDPTIRAAFVELVPADEVGKRAEALARELGALDSRSRSHHTRLLRALDRGPLATTDLAEHEAARTSAYARARQQGDQALPGAARRTRPGDPTSDA